jgi:hypothetical protein
MKSTNSSRRLLFSLIVLLGACCVTHAIPAYAANDTCIVCGPDSQDLSTTDMDNPTPAVPAKHGKPGKCVICGPDSEDLSTTDMDDHAPVTPPAKQAAHAKPGSCVTCGVDTQSTTTTDMGAGAQSPAQARKAAASLSTKSIDPTFCRKLIKATPDANVAYQGGVSASGKPVAPADLPGSPTMNLPDKIQIPLTLNLAQTLNLNTSSYPYNQLGEGTEAVLGTLSVEGDKVSFNGQPISDEQQNKLAVLCLQPK